MHSDSFSEGGVYWIRTLAILGTAIVAALMIARVM
jgi:hypothetical protein